MSNGSIARVRPGDLIRAEDFNHILDQLDALGARVSTLEGHAGGPGSLRIVSVSPEAPRVGDEMRVTGSNFGFSTGAARAFFDSVLVTAYKLGSTDNLLIFDVPELSGLPQTGRPTVLRVSNQTQSAVRTITVLPREVLPGGGVDLQYTGPTPATPQAGQAFTLGFALNSRTGSAVTMVVSPTVSVTAWQGSVQVLSQSGAPIPSRQVSVGANQRTPFSVRLQIPSTTASGTAFTVSVSAEGQGFEADSGPHSFTVGTAAPTPDPDIQLNLGDAIPSSALSGSTVTLPPGGSAEVIVLADFRQTGTYDITRTTAAGWTVQTDLPDPEQLVIEPSDMSEGWARRSFSIFLEAPATATPQRDLVVTARRQGVTQKRDQTLQLRTQ